MNQPWNIVYEVPFTDIGVDNVAAPVESVEAPAPAPAEAVAPAAPAEAPVAEVPAPAPAAAPAIPTREMVAIPAAAPVPDVKVDV